MDDKLNKVVDSLLGESDSSEYPPDIETQEVQGSAVRGRDRIAVGIGKYSSMGSPASYGIEISNPNRGAAYFAINDEADLDKLVDSFKGAIDGIRSIMQSHRAVNKEWWDKHFAKREG